MVDVIVMQNIFCFIWFKLNYCIGKLQIITLQKCVKLFMLFQVSGIRTSCFISTA